MAKTCEELQKENEVLKNKLELAMGWQDAYNEEKRRHEDTKSYMMGFSDKPSRPHKVWVATGGAQFPSQGYWKDI